MVLRGKRGGSVARIGCGDQLCEGEGVSKPQHVEKALLRYPSDDLVDQRAGPTDPMKNDQAREPGECEIQRPPLPSGELEKVRAHVRNIGRVRPGRCESVPGRTEK